LSAGFLYASFGPFWLPTASNRALLIGALPLSLVKVKDFTIAFNLI
jgi:hypothetical protein